MVLSLAALYMLFLEFRLDPDVQLELALIWLQTKRGSQLFRRASRFFASFPGKKKDLYLHIY